MPRNIDEMDPNVIEQFLTNNFRPSKSLGHYVHVGQTPYEYSRGECCVRCDQLRSDVKFDGEAEGHGRRSSRMKNHVQYCPSCHYMIQSSRYPTREAARGGSGVNAILDYFGYTNKAPLTSSMIKQTQSSTLSPRNCSHFRSENLPQHRPKRGSSSGHRQARRNDQEKISSIMRRPVILNMADSNVEEQQGFSPGGPIKSSFKKDVQRKSRQKTRDGRVESDRESECSFCHPQDLEDLSWESDRFKEQNRRGGEIGIEHQTESREKRPDTGDEEEQPRRTVHLASKYTATKNSMPLTNDGRLQSSMPREKNIEQILIKNGKKPERNVKIPSKVMSGEISGCEHDEQKEEQLQKELDGISYCGQFEPSMVFPVAECKCAKELEESLDAGRTSVSYEKESKEKEDENCILQKSDIDLHAMKNYIMVLIDKVLSKAFSDVKKNDVAKQEEIQQTVCLELTRLLQGDYCKPLAQSTVGHPTADCIKQLKKLRFDFLKRIQDEIRKLYNLEMLLDNCSPRHSLPIANSQSSNIDQRSNDRQQPQGQQQQMQQQQQQQQSSQEQQSSSATVANGLGKKMSESVL